MEAFLTAFFVVVLAELGDKTQLLAMAFAFRYDWRRVMLGVFIATVANHLLAVLVGVFLGSVINPHLLDLLMAIAFIIFGLWTLRGDELAGEDKAERHSPVLTVAVAFFLAEMGDKTQFATITVAAQYQALLPVLLGTTTGMMVADGLGIIIGAVLHKHIPDRALKYAAAAIFLAFGLYGLFKYFGA